MDRASTSFTLQINNVTTKDDVIVTVCKMNKKRKKSLTAKEKEIEEPREPEGVFMKVLCASREYHAYRRRLEKKYLDDPYAMGIYGHLPGKIAKETLAGHIPIDISRFCTLFTKHGGLLSAVVRETK